MGRGGWVSVSSLHMLSGTVVRSDSGRHTGGEGGESGDPEDASWHVGRLEGEVPQFTTRFRNMNALLMNHGYHDLSPQVCRGTACSRLSPVLGLAGL